MGKGKGSGVFSSKSSRKPKTCFALHMHVRGAPSQSGETLSQHQVALVAPEAQLPCLEHAVFCKIEGEERGGTRHPRFIS